MQQQHIKTLSNCHPSSSHKSDPSEHQEPIAKPLSMYTKTLFCISFTKTLPGLEKCHFLKNSKGDIFNMCGRCNLNFQLMKPEQICEQPCPPVPAYKFNSLFPSDWNPIGWNFWMTPHFVLSCLAFSKTVYPCGYLMYGRSAYLSLL